MTATSVSSICFTCKEETTTYSCPGCSNYFCFDDLANHRESLKPQFIEIEQQRNEFIEILHDQYKDNLNNHVLIKQINQWERISIEKIQRTANEQRQVLRHLIHGHGQYIQTKLDTLTDEMQKLAKRNDFNEIALNKSRKQLEDLKKQFHLLTQVKMKEDSSSSYINKLSIMIPSTLDRQIFYRHHLRPNLNWKQHAQTIAGGHGKGNQLNQLNCPLGIYVDVQQQSIYIADHYNHRIVKWKLGENTGQIIAGGTGKGHRIDQLNCPTDVIVDYNNKSLIICDYGNKRVVQCSLENQQDKQVLISDILCWGLILNENGDLFVSDCWKHEVRRWRKGSEKEGTIVAGGNGEGNKLNQLNHPTFIFVDRHESIYVSDWGNQRVMKWMKGAHEGIVVAGGQGIGDSLKQLYYPYGVIVNEIGDVFVNDHENHRIMCWPSGSKEGHIVVGGNGQGEGSNQFNGLRGLSFDVENNLYVVDVNNNRIQRFNVDNHEK